MFWRAGAKRYNLRPILDILDEQQMSKFMRIAFLIAIKTKSGETSTEQIRMVRVILEEPPNPSKFNLDVNFFNFHRIYIFRVFTLFLTEYAWSVRFLCVSLPESCQRMSCPGSFISSSILLCAAHSEQSRALYRTDPAKTCV